MNIKIEKYVAHDLTSETLRISQGEQSIGRLRDRPGLINVTGWSTPEMGFSRDKRRRTRVMITPQVMRALEDIPQSMIFLQTLRGRGGQLVILAARALIRARRFKNAEDATFIYPLPVDDEEYEDARLFRVEYVENTYGRPSAVIGFSAEHQAL